MDRTGEPGRFLLALDTIPQFVWIAGADGSLEYLNRRNLEYVGLPPDDLLGWDWGWVIHPDDLPRTLTIWNDSLLNGTPHEVEFRIRRHDGVYRWFLTRGLPLRDADGQVVRWYGTCTDIEERKRAEEQLRVTQGLFRALVERSDLGFALIGADRTVRYVNAAVGEMLGDGPEAFVGTDAFERAHPEDQDALTASLNDLLTRPFGLERTAHRYRHRDGSYRRLETQATNLLRDPDVRGIAITFWPAVDSPPAATGGL